MPRRTIKLGGRGLRVENEI